MKALYPGTFDPITYGHLDILERASSLFEEVVITVAVNTRKESVFTEAERVSLIEQSLEGKAWAKNVRVVAFTGLLVDHARELKVNTLIRGVRQLSDFEYEFRMALMNRRLAPEIDTVFLMPQEQLTFVSATIVREVAYWGGDLSQFVPDHVAAALRQKFPPKR
ncbi:MAG: pantetheine-phosphate adenylyltransferase [Candidatus Cyclonatronum sp.]|uniref:pantetheine-phosphate adenylyltransferase n=1 Tax=Cyclonatronum sp. TaxID=3024185 RepID=UPI0025B9CF81|nr:pantetheine-phosphate adenylyltransferase [Cyclonatronum sp.]MCC5933015.1 pantetheine-phosphate adenylyltransferase [Balneolales bacterium]MCH8485268.1 pantetheine-phosphate adenylyltransferase [Cyclonatronum sp.]